MQQTLPKTGYTVGEARKILGFHRTHIYKLVNQGKLSSFHGADGSVRISENEIYRFLSERDKS